jgi:hypothetical protein
LSSEPSSPEDISKENVDDNADSSRSLSSDRPSSPPLKLCPVSPYIPNHFSGRDHEAYLEIKEDMAKEAEKHGKFTNFTLGNESVREALGSDWEPGTWLPIRRFPGQDSRLAAQRLSTAL